MDDLAQANILDHYKYPRNRGVIEHPTVTREEVNPLCGDQIRVDMVINDGIVQDLQFSGRGCTISQASASMLTEALIGQPVETAKTFGKEELLELIGIPIGYTRMKCALLSLKAFKVGIYTVNGETWDQDEN